MKPCGISGCSRPHQARGYCKDHWVSAKRRGEFVPARYRTPEERFQERYIPEPNTGCWLWLGFVKQNGYGRHYANSGDVYAHRFSYELHRGAIPDGLHIDHLCRVRCCVNPYHLEAVTQGENTLRGATTSGINARKVTCPKCAGAFSLRNDGKRECRPCKKSYKRSWNARKTPEQRAARAAYMSAYKARRIADGTWRW
jgi:hypothetical protein